MRTAVLFATLLGWGFCGYVFGRATAPRPRPCPSCPPCMADAPELERIAARLDTLDARCVLLPERDRLAVVPTPKKAVP